MPVGPAEIVRTLAAGHRPAHAHLAGRPAQPVRTTTALDAAPILLVANDSPMAAALHDDAAIALRYDDRPPVPDAPWLGNGWICGWAEPVTGQRQRELAMVFSQRHPVNDLLSLGESHSLWQVDVAEIRLESPDGLTEIDVAQYRAAEADTWYPIEADLLMDLRIHHPEVLDALLGRIRRRFPQARRLNPLRMDRHGTTVDLYCGEVEDVVRRLLIRHRPGVSSPAQALACLACDCRDPH